MQPVFNVLQLHINDNVMSRVQRPTEGKILVATLLTLLQLPLHCFPSNLPTNPASCHWRSCFDVNFSRASPAINVDYSLEILQFRGISTQD